MTSADCYFCGADVSEGGYEIMRGIQVDSAAICHLCHYAGPPTRDTGRGSPADRARRFGRRVYHLAWFAWFLLCDLGYRIAVRFWLWRVRRALKDPNSDLCQAVHEDVFGRELVDFPDPADIKRGHPQK